MAGPCRVSGLATVPKTQSSRRKRSTDSARGLHGRHNMGGAPDPASELPGAPWGDWAPRSCRSEVFQTRGSSIPRCGRWASGVTGSRPLPVAPRGAFLHAELRAHTHVFVPGVPPGARPRGRGVGACSAGVEVPHVPRLFPRRRCDLLPARQSPSDPSDPHGVWVTGKALFLRAGLGGRGSDARYAAGKICKRAREEEEASCRLAPCPGTVCATQG